MKRQGRILIVEDWEKWRDEVGAALQREGFRVDAVASTSEAVARLNEDFYHLMLLDIRMEESDPDNVEGMNLLRNLNEHGDAMKIVVLSGHSTTEQMREAFRDFGVADFIAKENFNNDLFPEQVTKILTTESLINLDLEIHWEHDSGPDQAVVNLSIANGRIKRESPLQKRIAEELDDLLCRLFSQADSLLVRPLAPGTSGAGVLWVQPFYHAGAGRSVVVKFGDAGKIEKEYENFRQYVLPFVGGGRCTNVMALRRTHHLGGIEYSLLGAADDHVEDFEIFYRRSEVDQIGSVLDNLFANTCGDWYANLGKLMPLDLTKDYQDLLGLSLEKLEKNLPENLKSVQGKQNLHFKSLDGDESFTNPILALGAQHLRRPTYVCTTHGDFNEHNILVDSTGQTWLIDFLRTGRGHVLRDVAQLDSVVRLYLLGPEDASLQERLAMEKALCSIERFSQVEQLQSSFSTNNPAMAKTFATVVHLRTIARKLVAQNPRDEINEYYIALLYYSLNAIRFMDALSTVQREHALLSASLLASRLKL